MTTIELVKEYYGKTLTQTSDLKTDACCSPAALPPLVQAALAKVPREVSERYYGCGLTIPGDLEGLSVLDLGSGSGRDCYILSQLVGPKGRVVGVDMTPEQLDVARRNAGGWDNLEFREGDIQRLDGVADESFDLIVSNCVVNLAQDKGAVLRNAFRVLREGGELYFSDVYADRRVPEAVRRDPVLYGECLGGALYCNDFLRLARAAGFGDPRLVESRPLKAAAGNVRFFSRTYRLFKLAGLESLCEDYGQAVRFKGEGAFTLDAGHRFESGRMSLVCGNTYLMLAKTRLSRHFDFFGDFETHHGLFPDCGTTTADAPASDACC